MSTPAIVQKFMSDYGIGQYFNPNDPLLPLYDQIVATYADKHAQGSNQIRDNATMIYAFLMARQLVARHKVNGDCGQGTNISMPGYATGAQAANLGIATVGTIAGTVNGFAAGGTALAGAASGALAVLGPAAIVGVPLSVILGIIAKHHATAVAAEQSADCAGVNFVNQYFQGIAQAVQSGQLDWAAAKKGFDKVRDAALGAWAKTSQPSPCNAGCMYSNATKALHDLFVMLYGTAPSQGLTVNNPAAAGRATVAAQTPATAPGPLGDNIGLVVGAGAVGLHMIGAF